MAEQRIQCREHGGYFYREAQRGRKPVRCSEDNRCDADRVEVERAAKVAGRKLNVRVVSEEGDVTRVAIEGPRGAPKAQTAANASLAKGKAAKELLEAQGWDVAGKAWIEDPEEGGRQWASVSAVRGEERIHMVWQDGELQDQVYSLWNLDVPSKNGRPNANLPFDPDEVPDSELARLLIGVKVTWWNRLGQKEETAIIGKSLKISQEWSGTVDAYPGARVITFIDSTPNHTAYKSFRLDQLIEVG